MLSDIATGLGQGAVYALVGIALMALGVLVVDLLTPGDLRNQIMHDRNPNLGLIVAANLLGIGAIVTTAILTSEDSFGKGIASTAAYGISGLVLMAIGFVVVDLLTPGKLGAHLAEVQGSMHPAAWMTAAANLSTAAIVAAAIS